MPIAKINDNLPERLEEKLKVKHSTARSYASSIRGLWRRIRKEPYDGTLDFLGSAAMIRHIGNITNLSARKNASSAAIAGIKVTGKHDKALREYRELMTNADADFQDFLKAGKKKYPFENAPKEWDTIKKLHTKVARVVSVHGIWKRGEQVTYPEYRTLMALAYLKWISVLPVRRLEYTDTRFVDLRNFRSKTEDERKQNNWIVTGKQWTWEIYKYKTFATFGHKSFPVPPGLRNTLRKMQPIAAAKNAKGYIFLNTKWGALNRNLFSLFVKNVFKRYLNKNYTQNTVRAIKVSSVWAKPIKSLAVLQLGEDMGHSLKTQLLHYRKNPSAKTISK